MYKHKNKVSSPNFLDTKKSTYSKRRKTNSKRIQASLATVTTALIITIITVGFVDHVKVSANENTGGVYKEQSTKLAYNDETGNTETNNTESNTQEYSDNTKTVYIKEVNISPQFKYDSNSVEIVDNHLMCVKDDNILQWQKGRNRWECHKPTKTVFGNTEGMDIASDGTVKCKNTGEVLYWDDKKDNWNCASVGDTVYISDLLGVDISQNPQTDSLLTYNGLEWTDESISDILGREVVQSLTAVNAQLTNLLGVTSIDTTTEQTIYNALNDDFFAQGGNTFGANANLGTNDDYALLLRTNGAERVRITEDGNVGIGTSSPTSRLTIVQETDSSEGGINLRDSGLNGSLRLWTDTTGLGRISAGSNGNSNILINGDGSGNVGIGTDNPIHKLDVAGNIRAINTFYANGGINFRDNVSTLTDGNLLINYSDADRMASFNSTGFGGSSGMTFATSNTTEYAAERMRIDGDGNIGIGTTTPTEHLTLEGGNFLQTAVGDPTTKGNWDPNDTNVIDSPQRVEINGKYAYVTGYNSDNLVILDISDPTNPTTVGNWDPNDANVMDGARSVYVSGKYAYVTGGASNNLAIIDISDPTNPTTVGNWDPNDTNVMYDAYSVKVNGKYAYVAGQHSDNLVILDISDPTNPTTVGNWDPNDANVMDGPHTVQINGKYAYVGGRYSDNLAVLDISDPSNPITVGNWDPNDTNVMDWAVSVQVSGKYAYVAGGSSDNLVVVDISDPANPTTVGNWDPNDANVMDSTRSVQISGKYAYVTGSLSSNLAVVDISDLSNPTTVGNWDPNDGSIMSAAGSVQISGKYAYVTGANSDNLVIVDIAGIDAPSANIGSLATETLDVWGSADINNSLNIGGGLMVGSDAMFTGDLSMGNTLFVDSVNNNVGIGTTSPTEHLTLEGGNFLQTAVGDPTTKGNWDPNDTNVIDNATSVQISGKYAYITGYTSDNLAIVDISDPSNPTTVGNWDPNDANVMDGAYAIQLNGKYAYVIGSSSRNLVIVDISDPTNPTTVGNWDPNDSSVMHGARSVQISGKYAYVAGFNSSNLAIVDISDPSNPTTVGNWDPNDDNIIRFANSLHIIGNYAYVTGADSDNLVIVDVSDPSNPTTVGNWDPNDINVMNRPRAVQISGKYAYVTGMNSSNLAIVDISDPTNPTTAGNWDPNDSSVMYSARSVQISGKYAYVAGSHSDNLAIVDISDPSNPTTAGNWAPNDTNVMDDAYAIQLNGKYAYVTGEYSDNLAIVDISGIDAPSANIGSLATETLDVWGNADINNNLSIGTGLNVGSDTLIGGELAVSSNVRFSMFGAGTLQTDANGNLSVSSDERLKDIGGVFSRGLNDLLNISPISYTWKQETGYDTENTYYGFSAQNIQQNIPEAVGQDKRGYLTLSDRPILATAINAIKEQHLTISSNQLKTDTSITNLSQLQTSVDTQFASVSGMFDDVDKGMLEIDAKANDNADLIDALTLRVDAVQGGLDVLELLGATDALKLEELLAIDAEKLMFTDEEGDLTLDGVLNVNAIVAESVETNKLKAANVQLTRNGDAAIAGQGEFEANQLIADIETTAVTKDSLVFVTPYDTLAKSLSVSEIVCDENDENCTGFTVSREGATEEIMFFNWFIVDEDDSEDVE